MKKITLLLSLIIAMSATSALAEKADTVKEPASEITVETEVKTEEFVSDETTDDSEQDKDTAGDEEIIKPKKDKPAKPEKDKEDKPSVNETKNEAKETFMAYKAEFKEKKKEAKEYIRNIKSVFKDADNETRKEILVDIAAVKAALKDFSIDTFLNGTEIDYSQYDEVKPVIKEGRTIVPVRALTEALGATVDYDNETRTITITKDDTTIVMNLDLNIAYVNGEQVTLDVKPVNIKGRALVPIRFVAECFKLEVEWDGDSQTIVIE